MTRSRKIRWFIAAAVLSAFIAPFLAGSIGGAEQIFAWNDIAVVSLALFALICYVLRDRQRRGMPMRHWLSFGEDGGFIGLGSAAAFISGATLSTAALPPWASLAILCAGGLSLAWGLYVGPTFNWFDWPYTRRRTRS